MSWKLYNRTFSQRGNGTHASHSTGSIRQHRGLIINLMSRKDARFYNRIGGLHLENGGGKLIPRQHR